MRGTTNLSMAVRLGLIHADRVLVIEQDPHGPGVHSGSGSLQRSAHAANRVVASDIALAGTLLGSALAARKARFVSDCALYFQRALQPASDVFTPASQLVSSLVVVPFCDASPALGGIYFALDAPDDFAQLQAPILGVVSMVSVLLQRKLGGHADSLQERITKASTPSPLPSGSRAAAGGAAGAAAHAGGSLDSDPSNGALPSVQPSSLSFTSKRLNTDAIMKAVQLKLAMAHNGPDVHQSSNEAHRRARLPPAALRRAEGGVRPAVFVLASVGVQIHNASLLSLVRPCNAPPPHRRCSEDLVLEEALGRGGYGVCYRAHFRGATVAVKARRAARAGRRQRACKAAAPDRPQSREPT